MSLEADVAYLYLIDGVRQNEVPPGFSVHSAPRKAARGRDRDMLLVGLYLNGNGPKDFSDLVVSTYFGAPGSVTAAARATLQAANAHLFDYNRYPPASGPVTGGLCLAILRGDDLYVALLGLGQVVVAHPTAVERFPDSSTEPPAFGLDQVAEVQYFHSLLAASDYALLTPSQPTGWESNSLTNLPGASLESAIARLTRLAGANASALIARFTAEDAATTPVKGRPSITAAPLQSAASASAASPTTVPQNMLEPAAPVEEPAPVALPRTEAPAVRAPIENEPAVDDTAPAPKVNRSSLAGIIARVRAAPALGLAKEEEPPAPEAEVTLAVIPPETMPSPVAPASRAASVASVASPASAASDGSVVQIGDHVYEFEEDKQSEGDAEAEPEEPQTPLVDRLRGGMRGVVAKLPLHRASAAVQQGSETLGASLSDSSGAMLRRVLPEGTLRPDAPVRIPDRVWLAIAVLLPIVIAVVVGVIYVQRGRNQQFIAYLDHARLEAGLARTAADPLAAKPHWQTALQWLDQADRVFPGQVESAALRAEAESAVDAVDGVQRLNLQSLVPTGFGSGAQISQIVVQGTEVYALDTVRQVVYRALFTDGNKFIIDRNFQCQLGVVGSVVIKHIVALTWLDTPNIVGQPALMALDADGDVMYCKTDDTAPEASTLIPPDSGWKTPEAIQIYADRLYVFDPGTNNIWSYDRVGGVFSDRPKSYFTGQVLDLSNAINFIIAQGEVYILRKDGRLTYCARDEASGQISCIENSLFADSRPGHTSGDHIDDVSQAVSLYYDPPPEPSLYLLDATTNSVYELSLKLVLQKVYKSAQPLPGPATAVGIGPNKEVFVSAGNNVYWSTR